MQYSFGIPTWFVSEILFHTDAAKVQSLLALPGLRLDVLYLCYIGALPTHTLHDLLGITQQTYSNYETGIHEPPLRHVKKLAIFYNVSSDYLLALSQFKQSAETITNLLVENARSSAIIDTIFKLPTQDLELVADFTEMLRRRREENNKKEGQAL